MAEPSPARILQVSNPVKVRVVTQPNFTITAGNTGTNFAIDEATGELTTASLLIYGRLYFTAHAPSIHCCIASLLIYGRLYPDN